MTPTLLALQALNGLQFGLILFLIAAGLTLVFGVMDFINLAHGVQYMVGAYLAAFFTSLTGSFALGLALALPAALASGLVLEVAVFRHLYARSHLDQVLATFGLIIFLNEGVRALWGAAPLSVPVPDALSGSVELVPGVNYPVYRLAIIAAGLGVAALLYGLVSHTRVGMLVRAGATNAPMVSALGIDIRRLFTFVSGFGAMLAGFAGAMVAPILSVEPGMGDNVLILAFVVIVIGGIGSVRGAFLGALLVGLVDTLGRFVLPVLLRALLDPAAASGTGRALAPMLIYLLMAFVLFVRPAGLFPAAREPDRSVLVPAVKRDLLPVLLFVALALVPLGAKLGPEAFVLSVMTRVVVLALAALSLDLLVGTGGLVSFGHAAFVGIGAYAVGILSSHGIEEGLVQLAVAFAAAGLFALVTGAAALRTEGVSFIMITLAFGQMLFFLATSLSGYGGDDGMTLPSRSLVGGAPVLGSDAALYGVSLAALAAVYLGGRRLVRSRFGRVLAGSRENPARMAAIGFDPFRFRLVAYMLSGMVAALAGVLAANATEFVSPATLSWQRSGDLIFMVVLGGLGTLHGAILGAAAFLLLEEVLSHALPGRLGEHWRLVFGPLLVAAVLFGRGGLARLLGGRRP